MTNGISTVAASGAPLPPVPAFIQAGSSSAEASANETTSGNRGGGRGRHKRGRGGERNVGAGGRDHRGRTGETGPPHDSRVHGQVSQRGGRGNSGTQTHAHAPTRPARQFEGRLTENVTPPTQLNSSLQADAPSFVPGVLHQQRARPPRRGKPGVRGGSQTASERPANAIQHRRASIEKSNAPDIATRTHEDISNSIYECPICTTELSRKSKIWSCHTCWTVFHLGCIKTWSTNEGSTLTQQRNQEDGLPQPRQWRCPGCNLPQDILPSTYTCWCEKESDPRSISGLPPHSCGQSCGKPRKLPKSCPHPCDLLCHAGPCPPCTHGGPTQSCFCGKKSTSRRCIDTNYDSGWSCAQECGTPMPCGEHLCKLPCHEGSCGPCEVQIDCRCYCGNEQDSIPCNERGDQIISKHALEDTLTDEWTGMFDCGKACNRMFDCGKHRCEKHCHPQDLLPPSCPKSPDVVTHCPCGKSSLEGISSSKRQSCEDPIPSCDKPCLKPLGCGHDCQQECHAGQCMPCLIQVDIACRCGRTSSKTICHQGSEELPQCMRACKAKLNCGRHECGDRCCTGERKAAERQATKRKLRPLGAPRILDELVEAEHICTRTCGRPLKCGNHTCPELCHKGPCASCREAIFDEVSCSCGKTVLQPPLPCGTSSPLCRFACERPKTCGHPKVPHNCHGDESNCPKCPFLGQKVCMCGKQSLKNQPCWLAQVRCGEVCGKKLRCGSHYCRKDCHRDGECEDVGQHCQQACGRAKRSCGDPCEHACHAPSPCKEDDPCQSKMLVTCECQNLKQETKCLASKTSSGNHNKTLPCDDECARLARNHRLALALDIDPDARQDDHIPYKAETLKLYRENTKWAEVQEREFRVFAADQNEKRLRFKPMSRIQRKFLHCLSEDFGMDSESLDPEPYRHIAVFKTPRFVIAPMKTLRECVRIMASNEAAVSTQETSKKLQKTIIPYNGFLLGKPRFGLTLDEVSSDLASILKSTPGLVYSTVFLPSEEIAIKALPASTSTVLTESAIDANLKALKSSILDINSAKNLASTIQLCSLDSSLNVLSRELDESETNGGWSKVGGYNQVAAKATVPRTVTRQTALGQKNMYTVLGSKVRDAKSKKEEQKKRKETEPVFDDWEEAVEKEELDEKQRVETALDQDHEGDGTSFIVRKHARID